MYLVWLVFKEKIPVIKHSPKLQMYVLKLSQIMVEFFRKSLTKSFDICSFELLFGGKLEAQYVASDNS